MKVGLMAETGPIGNDEPWNWMVRLTTYPIRGA
jgi:hypothetical protein